jgi:23S rRNA (adenine2503-C2)-methyltransferase
MRDGRKSIFAATPESLADWFRARGQPSYRVQQVCEWLYARHVLSFEEMTNLPATLREALAEDYQVSPLREVERLCSADGRTVKLAFEIAGGARIESVLMRGGRRPTFCVSSQAGCAMGCRFCATGAAGLSRNLSMGEVIGQVVALACAAGEVGNIVMMGMGEPLVNLDAVLPALDAMADPARFGLGARRITLSTAGITPGIRRLATARVQPNLALSVNSPFDRQRTELMPINGRYPLAGVLEACRGYAQRSGRRMLLEYVLLGGVNTSQKAARALASMARRLHAMVNLIAYNPVTGCEYKTPEDSETRQFRATLEQAGVAVTQRFRRGRDIKAACGQLAGRPSAEH